MAKKGDDRIINEAINAGINTIVEDHPRFKNYE
jgi:hypothetical protein